MVDRGTWPEHHAKGQRSRDGIDIGDGAWSQHGAGDVHGTGEGGSDRMRGDRVGVGDVDEVQYSEVGRGQSRFVADAWFHGRID